MTHVTMKNRIPFRPDFPLEELVALSRIDEFVREDGSRDHYFVMLYRDPAGRLYERWTNNREDGPLWFVLLPPGIVGPAEIVEEESR